MDTKSTSPESESQLVNAMNQLDSKVEIWVAIRCKNNGTRRTLSTVTQIPCSGAKPGLADGGKSN